MRAVALTCTEFKGHLIIKVDVCESAAPNELWYLHFTYA